LERNFLSRINENLKQVYYYIVVHSVHSHSHIFLHCNNIASCVGLAEFSIQFTLLKHFNMLLGQHNGLNWRNQRHKFKSCL